MNDRDDIIARHGDGTLLELFIERAGRHMGDETGESFRTALAELHNAGTIDVLDAARRISSSPINQHDFFKVMHLYCKLIPVLQAEVPAMLTAVTALVERAGNDLASGMPHEAYRTWAQLGDRARIALATVDEQAAEDSVYVFLSLQALATNAADEALAKTIAYLRGSADPTRWAAAKAIGTIFLPTLEARKQAVDALAAATAKADDNTLGHILTAVCEIVRSHTDTENSALALIEAATSKVGDQAIHQLSFELMFHGEELPPAIVNLLTAIMHKVVIRNRGTIDNIDAAGGKLALCGRLDEALKLITPLIVAHEDLTSLEALDAFSHALLELPSDQLSKVLVDWLRSLDRNLGHATMSLVGQYRGETPLLLQADNASQQLHEAELVLLARRAVGYLFMHPITASSLVLGFLRAARGTTAEEIAELLFDPLMINFSGELADWLRACAKDENDPIQPVITQLLNRLETYLDGLLQVGTIKELRPSERERMIEHRRQHDSMQQAHRDAEKKSILSSLFSRSVLLYGTGAISYFGGPDGQSKRNEMKLQSFSHSIESPRLAVLEPFDLDYTLRVFRATGVAKP